MSAVREQVRNLIALGPMPDEHSTTEEQVEAFETRLSAIEKPVTDEEARALTKLFGPDTYYGLAWTMLHLVETAPSWPLKDCLTDLSNEWIKRLRDRAERGGHCFD
ncbi:MAG: hypothetical protein ACLPX9_05125 [Rhodomicrobium sp.]